MAAMRYIQGLQIPAEDEEEDSSGSSLEDSAENDDPLSVIPSDDEAIFGEQFDSDLPLILSQTKRNLPEPGFPSAFVC